MSYKSKEITKKLRQCVAYMKNKSYLCNVFFMVLDFKVKEKGLSWDSPFFICRVLELYLLGCSDEIALL